MRIVRVTMSLVIIEFLRLTNAVALSFRGTTRSLRLSTKVEKPRDDAVDEATSVPNALLLQVDKAKALLQEAVSNVSDDCRNCR